MNSVNQFGMDTVGVVSTLVTANRYLQALVLLYSAIDTLAWVSLSAGDVTRTDFCRWVNLYMQPQSSLGCTAEDLYGARCSILHSSTTESKMSREGRVHELWYVTSPYSVTRLEAYVQKVGAQAKVVYFAFFVAAFADGVRRFSDDLTVNPNQHAQCSDRMKRWLRCLPTGSLEVSGEGQ